MLCLGGKLIITLNEKGSESAFFRRFLCCRNVFFILYGRICWSWSIMNNHNNNPSHDQEDGEGNAVDSYNCLLVVPLPDLYVENA